MWLVQEDATDKITDLVMYLDSRDGILCFLMYFMYFYSIQKGWKGCLFYSSYELDFVTHHLSARWESCVLVCAAPPLILQDKSLGTHGYVKANGIQFHYVSAGDTSKPLMLFLHGFPEVSLQMCVCVSARIPWGEFADVCVCVWNMCSPTR